MSAFLKARRGYFEPSFLFKPTLNTNPSKKQNQIQKKEENIFFKKWGRKDEVKGLGAWLPTKEVARFIAMGGVDHDRP